MGDHAEKPVWTLEELSEQVQNLKSETNRLSARLKTLESGIPTQQSVSLLKQQGTPVQQAQPAQGPAPLVDTSILLPRIATICFLMVVALILRTITDNQIINIQAGSYLGMGYAAVLILMGWRLYGKGSRLAPVFPGCGILLLFSIVMETHVRYESLSTVGAYAILFLGGAVVFAISIRHRATALICFGVPGTAAVAMAIDFPYPIFPVLGLLLLAAIVAASYAYKQQMCRYLRWTTLTLSALFWLLWTAKMDTLPTCAEPVAEAMYPDWFFPMVFCFWFVYLATVLLNVLKKDLQLGFFESIIPSVTAVGSFGAGYVTVSNWFEKDTWFYTTMVVIATLHLGLAWWLAMRDREKASGANVFILAGACLFFFTSATVFRQIGFVLPIWSASALGLAFLSALLHNEGIRVTSNLLQITACATAIVTGTILVPTSAPLATGITAMSICLFGLFQYKWNRAHAPNQAHSFFFSKLDKNNYSAVALLISGLLGGYYFAQFVLYEILGMTTADFTFQFKSGQSLIINTGALVLMAIALKKRNKEIVLIATAVALFGAGKVFIFDLFGIKGVPLVLSVFSTGVVAAFGSIVMGKWQKKSGDSKTASA